MYLEKQVIKCYGQKDAALSCPIVLDVQQISGPLYHLSNFT